MARRHSFSASVHGRTRLKRAVVLTATLALSVLSVGLVTVLHGRANSYRQAELGVAKATTSLNELVAIAFAANPAQGGSPSKAKSNLATTEARIDTTLGEVHREHPSPDLVKVGPLLRSEYTVLERIRRFDAAGNMPAALGLGAEVERGLVRATTVLRAASNDFEGRASDSLGQATGGSAVAILLLLGGFALFYRRSWTLADSNHRLLATSRSEALTDVLTGLGNRRAFTARLDDVIAGANGGRQSVLVLLDLDGFKHYNDSFGHPAGDALLARLAGHLSEAISGAGDAFRLGGDEFCVLAAIGDEAGDGEAIACLAAASLSEGGDGFYISCSYGQALLPDEASSSERALGLADARMYAQKSGGRVSTERQTTDVLLRVLGERDPGLEQHLDDVGHLAQEISERLGIPGDAVEQIRLAAELHDVGKTAIPDSILHKPGPLDKAEQEFMRRHTVIGERILLAAPALAHTAMLVRSSHERIDGSGYPDQLRGNEIPLGSRIIAVCDAYDAMVSDRPYRAAMSPVEAITELRRCSGSQFDPDVVAVFERLSYDLAPRDPDPDGFRPPSPQRVGR